MRLQVEYELLRGKLKKKRAVSSHPIVTIERLCLNTAKTYNPALEALNSAPKPLDVYYLCNEVLSLQIK